MSLQAILKRTCQCHVGRLKKFLRNRTLCRSLRQNGGIRQWHIYQEPQCLHVGLDVSTSRYHAPRKTSTSNDQQALKFGHQARPGNSALVERTDSRVSRFSNAIAKFQAAQAYKKETRWVHGISPKPETVTDLTRTCPKKSRHEGGHHRQGQGRKRWFKTSLSWEGGAPPTPFPIAPMMLASKMFSDQLKPGDVLFPTAAESRRRTRRTRHNLTFQGQTFHFDICP